MHKIVLEHNRYCSSFSHVLDKIRHCKLKLADHIPASQQASDPPYKAASIQPCIREIHTL